MKKYLKKFFRVFRSTKTQKTVMTLARVFLVNYISRYHVLYIFRNKERLNFKKKNKMGECVLLSIFSNSIVNIHLL